MNILNKLFGVKNVDNTSVLSNLAAARQANAEATPRVQDVTLAVWLPISEKLNADRRAEIYPAVWGVMGTSVEELQLWDSGGDIGAWMDSKLYVPTTTAPFVPVRTYLVVSAGSLQQQLSAAFAKARAYLQGKAEIVALSKALEDKADRQEAAIAAGTRDGVNGEDAALYYTRHVFVRAIVRCSFRRVSVKTKEGVRRNAIEFLVKEFVEAPSCAHPQNLPLDGDWMTTAMSAAAETYEGIIDAAAQHAVSEARKEADAISSDM